VGDDELEVETVQESASGPRADQVELYVWAAGLVARRRRSSTIVEDSGSGGDAVEWLMAGGVGFTLEVLFGREVEVLKGAKAANGDTLLR
jgi:hypothetical protein